MIEVLNIKDWLQEQEKAMFYIININTPGFLTSVQLAVRELALNYPNERIIILAGTEAFKKNLYMIDGLFDIKENYVLKGNDLLVCLYGDVFAVSEIY